MQFQRDMIPQILAGQKTQTRRPARRDADGTNTPGMEMLAYHGGVVPTVVRLVNGNWRTKYQVGGSYAVQPGRGERCIWYYATGTPVIMLDDRTPSGGRYTDEELTRIGYRPLRIVLTAIHREDVRNISIADAHAEGFDTPADFLTRWALFYDTTHFTALCRGGVLTWSDRPAALYQAWALTFTVDKPKTVVQITLPDADATRLYEHLTGNGNAR